MRISILTIGAMGDTQPFVALAFRLKKYGHDVRLAARPDFARWRHPMGSILRHWGILTSP